MPYQRPKKYYPAGIISIVLLPIFCLLYLKSQDAFVKYGVLQFSVWDGHELYKGTTKMLHSRKYAVLNFTGREYSDQQKIDRAAFWVKQLMETKDLHHGIRFHFEKKATYQTYTSIIDILVREKVSYFVPYKNDIWFAIPQLPKHKLKSMSCGASNHLFYNFHDTGFFEGIDFKTLFYRFFPSIMVYVYLLFLVFKKA